MATATTPAKRKVVRSNKPRVFYMIYKGQLEGQPTVTFDKEVALDKLLEANSVGDTSFKMQKMEVPRGKPRAKSDAPAAA